MSETAVYMGYGTSGLDGRGRFTLPAQLRSVLAESCRNPNSFLLSVDADYPYLSVFGDKQTGYFQEKFEERARRAESRGEDMDEVQALADFWVGIVPVTIDTGGRFSLPDGHADYAGITNGLFVVGGGPRIQLWDPECFLASNPKNPVARNACAKFIADRAGKQKGQS